MKVIFAFGDSLTYGCYGQSTNGWTSLLRRHLDNGEHYPNHYVYALGIPGETSKGLVKRFSSEVSARRRDDDDDYTVLIACGANDATWLNGENRFKKAPEEYFKNMTEVAMQAKLLGADIRLLNITPVNEEYSRQFKGKNKSCHNEYVDRYNQVLAEVATKSGVKLLDVNTTFRERGTNNLLTDDGLHPNDLGHQVIFESVRSELKF